MKILSSQRAFSVSSDSFGFILSEIIYFADEISATLILCVCKSFLVLTVGQRLFLYSPFKPYNALGVRVNLMGESAPNVSFCITR